jgi:hypothetical protein
LANIFELDRYRFHFRAIDAVRFPAQKSGNVFRGAFGMILRNIACEPQCPGAATCTRRRECAYARLFEPSLAAAGPSPFVFRCRHLDAATFPPGADFFIDVHVFESRFDARPWFERVFERLLGTGLGPGRSRAQLTKTDCLGHMNICLDPPSDPITRIWVRFVTPTELKAAGEVRNEPNFADLFARVRDRLSSLSMFYGRERLAVDFAAMAARAASVRTARMALQYTEASRRSTRTGQTHSIGGLTGDMEFMGNLGEFLPWMACARWTGVGRHTVWGNGELHVIRAV